MSSWSRVGKPSWRTCAGIAPSLHCTVRLRPSGPFSAGLCWIKPSSGSVWLSPSSKPISTLAAAGMTVRDRQPRDTPRRDGKPPVGAKRHMCARRQDGRVRRFWPHKSLHATNAAGRHPDRSAKGVHQAFTQGLVPRRLERKLVDFDMLGVDPRRNQFCEAGLPHAVESLEAQELRFTCFAPNADPQLRLFRRSKQSRSSLRSVPSQVLAT